VGRGIGRGTVEEITEKPFKLWPFMVGHELGAGIGGR